MENNLKRRNEGIKKKKKNNSINKKEKLKLV